MSDLLGAGRLVVDATAGITDLVEEMHHTIESFAGLFGVPCQHRTTGVTGVIYQNIRSVSELVGIGIDATLGQLVSLLEDGNKREISSPGREAMLAALNGLIGDHLASSGNPLAVTMELRQGGEPLNHDDPEISRAVMESGGKIALMVHGLCMNDLEWNRNGHDHGAALALDLGYLPLYLNYNSGLHISENGRSFSEIIESFLDNIPHPIEIVIIAHSMGGLVSRSACHYGKLAGHRWLSHLKKIVFLGTPHHGAPLEQGGNWINNLLSMNPYSAPFAKLGKMRSTGVTDLRYGNMVDDDWKESDRFVNSKKSVDPLPLPDGVECYAIAATIAKEPSALSDHLVGDGLVPLTSALGHHEDGNLDLMFPKSHQWTGRNMDHMDLLDQPEVYETIRMWLQRGYQERGQIV